ncbi:oligosaccharide flippase family protein [uncultured Winogradskyella sp.]|uniref:lipopolysaccharide biosynthesis protein n=1 Tax=uncultured Winogradskyella sp. TaxID=395353 RepID=UPI00262FDE4F|nr:oligosaccharide flippase family protein [uncultured Winogradskyella sp.]
MFKLLLKGSVFKLFDFIRPLVVIPFFIRSFGVDSYGVYVQIVLIATLMYPILDMGIGMGVQRFSDKLADRKLIREIFGIQRVAILFFCAMYTIAMLFVDVRELIFGPYESNAMILSSFFYILFFSLNNTLQGVLRAQSKIGKLVKYRAVFTGLEAVLLLTVLYFIKEFSYYYILVMVLCQIIYFLLLVKHVNGFFTFQKASFKLSQPSKKFFKYSLVIIPTALIGWITSSSDRFFITDYFGSESTGYYSALAQYTGYMKLIVFPFTFVYFKEFSKLFDKDFKGFKVLFLKCLSICIGLSLLFFLCLYIFRDFVFFSYLGLSHKPEFEQLVIWFLISFLLINIASFLSTYMLVSKQTKIMLYAISLGAITNFILNKFFLKDYNYANSAFYWAISVGLQILILSIFVIRNIKMNEKNTIR